MAAIAIMLAGAGILLGGDALVGDLGVSDLVGIFCAALATATGAICSVLSGPYVRQHGVVRVSFVAIGASLIPLGFMALLERGGHSLAEWSSITFMLVAFVGLSSGIGYLLWLYALAHAPAGIVASFLALSPITAVLLSVLLMETPVTISLAVSIFLIVGGLTVTALPPMTRKGRERPAEFSL